MTAWQLRTLLTVHSAVSLKSLIVYVPSVDIIMAEKLFQLQQNSFSGIESWIFSFVIMDW